MTTPKDIALLNTALAREAKEAKRGRSSLDVGRRRESVVNDDQDEDDEGFVALVLVILFPLLSLRS